MAGGGGVRGGTLLIPQMFGPQGQPLDIDGIVEAQGRRKPKHLRAYCKVYMNGRDLTDQLDPVLLSVRITDRKLGASVATMTIDDAYGKIPNPPDGSQCSIALGWPDEGAPKQFTGTLTGCWSAGQRQQGRTMDLEFTSYDQGGDGKTTLKMNWGKGKDDPDGGQDIPFSQIAKELAEKAGIKNFQIAPAIGDVKRKYWSVDNETPLGALERLSKEVGGNFSMDGSGGGISDPNSGQAADGTALTANACVVAENVLAWRIIPSMRRAQWGKLFHGFFDRDKGAPHVEGKGADAAFGFSPVQAKRMGAWPTNDEEMAKTSAKSDVTQSLQKRGTGWTVVDGMPKATAGGMYSLNGYKPGVDGDYKGEEVEHSYFRGGGYITRIDVEHPELYSSVPSGQWKSAPN